MADSPNVDTDWLGGEADGEEEPLFADDLMDDEDDPPPLPPPMPSLGELSANRHRVRFRLYKQRFPDLHQTQPIGSFQY